LKNGIQVKGMGMGPGFHRGDNNAGMTEIESDFSSTNSQSLSNRRARHDELSPHLNPRDFNIDRDQKKR
jgi:hypothetical protein